jgi:hypothetical protein
MKKLVFTALAVVAFSGVAMANTVEVKEAVVINNEVKAEKANLEGSVGNDGEATECENIALDFYEVIIGDGADNIDLLNELIAACH